jgi:protein-disulfide isomerase
MKKVIRGFILNKTRWIIFSVIVVGIVALLISMSGGSQINVNDIDVNAVQKASEQKGKIADHVFGKNDSKVTLIEYGDFQCGPCGSIHPIVKSVIEEYKNQLQYVFRNYPIADSHPNARAAAASAEAAGLQGKYWQMHDKIFDTQVEWSDLSIDERSKFFESLAADLKLDVDRFNLDIKKAAISQKINYDQALAVKSGVDATPTFFLNGKKLTTDQYGDESKFKETINTELKKFNIDPPK